MGRPVDAALAGQAGLSCVCWPGGVIEAELAPERSRQVPPRVMSLEAGELTIRVIQGEECRLELSRHGEVALHPLPNGAEPPEVRRLHDGGLQLLGQVQGGGRYLLALGDDISHAPLRLDAREIELSEDGSVRAMIDMLDSVGHARLMSWTRAGDLYLPGEPETLWSEGAPRWPDTPEKTALAALEAAKLGLMDEALAYLTPGAENQAMPALREAAESDGSTALKYPLPSGRQAVGLVRMISDNCAQVRPVSYHAQPMGGSQGAWRLSKLEIEP